jgi:hypothetical protein
MSLKRAFYPSGEIESYLESIPRGQLSSRINELILKGLSLERQMKVAQDYQQFNEALTKPLQHRGKEKKRVPETVSTAVSTTMMMSEKAFEPEDEAEDFF